MTMLRFVGVLLALLVQQGISQELRVKDIRCHLIYEYSGRLSLDVTGEEPFALWNVLIGGGDAEEPSSATLVDVAFEGPPKHWHPSFRSVIEVVDERTGRLIHTEKVSTGLFSKEGRWHRALLVRGQFCSPIQIRVRAGRRILRSETLNFHCGE